MTYIIEDMCPGSNSSFVEKPDEFREIVDVIRDGKTFVGTYPNNFSSRYLICKGETGTGCGYSIITDRNVISPRDSLVQDTLSCSEGNLIIYVNATDRDIAIKVTILEKCQSGTLDIIVRKRDYTPLRHSYRVNQTPSTTRLVVWKNSFIQLYSFGTGGRVVYKIGFD
jgi:hypothetical protein